MRNSITAGSFLNDRDENGHTPLHLSTIRGHKEIAELLIAKGADVNAKLQDGFTPLHYAADEGHKEVVELLIAKGADVNAKYEECATSLDWAKNQETADLLRKHDSKTYLELEAEGK